VRRENACTGTAQACVPKRNAIWPTASVSASATARGAKPAARSASASSTWAAKQAMAGAAREHAAAATRLRERGCMQRTRQPSTHCMVSTRAAVRSHSTAGAVATRGCAAANAAAARSALRPSAMKSSSHACGGARVRPLSHAQPRCHVSAAHADATTRQVALQLRHQPSQVGHRAGRGERQRRRRQRAQRQQVRRHSRRQSGVLHLRRRRATCSVAHQPRWWRAGGTRAGAP
jgi:hypothetical protein